MYGKRCFIKSSEGTPYELKGSRTVWNGGKVGDNIKHLPIVIISSHGLYILSNSRADVHGVSVKLKSVDYFTWHMQTLTNNTLRHF